MMRSNPAISKTELKTRASTFGRVAHPPRVRVEAIADLNRGKHLRQEAWDRQALVADQSSVIFADHSPVSEALLFPGRDEAGPKHRCGFLARDPALLGKPENLGLGEDDRKVVEVFLGEPPQNEPRGFDHFLNCSSRSLKT